MWRLAAFLIPFLTHSALSGDVGRLYWVSPLFCVFFFVFVNSSLHCLYALFISVCQAFFSFFVIYFFIGVFVVVFA